MDLGLAELLLTAAGLAASILFGYPVLDTWLRRRSRRNSEPKKTAALNQIQDGPVTWRCGIYDYHPLSTIDPMRPDEAQGPYVDLIRDILSRMGIKATMTPFIYSGFYDGTEIPDVVVGMFETERRKTRVVFSTPIHDIGLQGLCKIDLEEDVLDGIREGRLRVAVYNGEVGWEYVHDDFRDAFKDQRVATVDGGRQLDTTDHLKGGKYHVILMDELSCVNFLRDGENAASYRLAFPERIENYHACIGLRKDHEALLPALNKALEEARNDEGFLRREIEALATFETVVRRRSLRPRRRTG